MCCIALCCVHVCKVFWCRRRDVRARARRIKPTCLVYNLETPCCHDDRSRLLFVFISFRRRRFFFFALDRLCRSRFDAFVYCPTEPDCQTVSYVSYCISISNKSVQANTLVGAPEATKEHFFPLLHSVRFFVVVLILLSLRLSSFSIFSIERLDDPAGL